MEESDKTTALKKAYAEIILNTAKESAARVLVSDRKSARFHHDLCGTKEEALRLLVRMKQMIDAKTIEAEITSSNKQREIDVLEAQLQEAEDIITDLRSELRYVRDKLEKAKIVNESQARNVETISAQNNGNRELVAGSLHPNDEKRSSVNTTCETELDVGIRNKKLELFRNGCTQRIHALERKSSSCANEEEQCITEKDSETGVLGSTRCLVLGLRSRNAEVMITKPSNALGIKRGRKKRKWGKRKATSVRSQSQLLKACQSQSDLPCSKTSMENSDGEYSMETNLSVESEEVDTLYTDDIDIMRKGKRSKNSTDHLVESCEESNLVSINVEYDENESHLPENETEINPLPPLEHGLTNVDTTLGLTNVTISIVNATNRSTDKDLKSRKEDALVKCEGGEDSVVPSTKMGSDSELVNLHSDSKVTSVVSDQISESPRADANRLVMYTFQRRRKKGSLIENNGNTSSLGEREVKEKEKNAQDPTESTLSNEPSRETPAIS